MAQRVLLFATLAFVAHRALQPLAETDLFFHLKLGEILVETGEIPFRNLFSFTHPAAPDPDLAWGFQVLVWLAFRAGGFGAVVFLKVVLIVAAAALVHRACRAQGAGPLASCLAVVLATVVAEPRFVERPHLVTLVGIGALMALLARDRVPAWLPLGVAAWANFHAGVFFAPLLLALHGIGAILDGRAPARRFWMITAASAAAMFASPANLRLLGYLSWHTGLGATRIVEEFRLADPWNDSWMFALAALCVLSAPVVASWRRLLPIVVVFALAARSVRFAAEWALIAAPFAATGLSAIAPRRQWLPAAALLALIAYQRADAPPPLELADDLVPFDAIEFATKNGLRERLYVDLDVGCYLVWEGWPRYRVFQDARLPAYPDEFHRALDETPLDGDAFDALLARHGVDAALLNYPDINMRAGSFPVEKWALVYRSDDALVFTRRLVERASLIAANEIPLRPRFAFVGGTRFEPIWDPPDGVSRCDWDQRLLRALADDPVRAWQAAARARAHDCRYSAARWNTKG